MPFITQEQLSILEQLASADEGVESVDERLLPEAWKTLFHEMVTDKEIAVPDLSIDFASRLAASLSKINLNILIEPSQEDVSSRNKILLVNILSEIEKYKILEYDVLKLRSSLSLASDAISAEDSDDSCFFEEYDSNCTTDDADLPEANKSIETQPFSDNPKLRSARMKYLASLFNKGDNNFDTYSLELLITLAPDNIDLTYEFFRENLVNYPLNEKVADLIMVLNTAMRDAYDMSDEPDFYENAMRFLGAHAAHHASASLLKSFKKYCDFDDRIRNSKFAIKFREESTRKPQLALPDAKKVKLTTPPAIANQHSTQTKRLFQFQWPSSIAISNTIQAKSLPEQKLDYWLSIPKAQREAYLPKLINDDLERYEQEKNRIKKSIDQIKQELRNTFPRKLNENSTLDAYIYESNEDDDEGYHYLLTKIKELLVYFGTPEAETRYQQHQQLHQPNMNLKK